MLEGTPAKGNVTHLGNFQENVLFTWVMKPSKARRNSFILRTLAHSFNWTHRGSNRSTNSKHQIIA